MSQHRTPAQPLSQLLTQRPLQAVPTSVPELDRSLRGGIVPSHIYEVSGLNNSGKASLASQICLNAMSQYKTVLWITMIQDLPTPTLLRFNAAFDPTRLVHHRITTIGELFIFLLHIPPTYGLIIIDDFAYALNRSIGELEDMITRPKISLETRRNKTILDFMKLLKHYCTVNKSSCVLFNHVDTENMTFIKTNQTPDPETISTQSSRQVSLSSTSSTSSSQPPPQKFHQQVLKSGLGDHYTWSSHIRSRLMLYKDVVQGIKTATFVHIRHCAMIRKDMKAKGIEQGVVNFSVTIDGLKSVECTQTHPARSRFEIDERDFESDGEVDDHVIPETTVDITQADSTVLDAVEGSVEIPSSPHRYIQNARELLSSQLEEMTADDEGEVRDDKENNQSDDITIGAEASHTNESTADLLKAIDETMEDPVGIVPHQIIPEVQNVPSVSVVSNTLAEVYEPAAEIITPLLEHITPQTHDQQDSESQSPSLSFHTPSSPPPADPATQEDLDAVSMVADVSLEVHEIDDEMEELYPTQPEDEGIIRLTQLQTSKDDMRKRSMTTPAMLEFKRTKFQEEESQDIDDCIPQTFPF